MITEQRKCVLHAFLSIDNRRWPRCNDSKTTAFLSPPLTAVTFQLCDLHHDPIIWLCTYRKLKFDINTLSGRTSLAQSQMWLPGTITFGTHFQAHNPLGDRLTALGGLLSKCQFWLSSKSPEHLRKQVALLWSHMKRAVVAVASHMAILGTCKESNDITKLCWSSKCQWQAARLNMLTMYRFRHEQASRGMLSKILVTFSSQDSITTRWTWEDCTFLQ